MKRFARRPSPALVISCIALFIAMGGVSYGVATGSIDGREIKNGSVGAIDIKKRSITGNQIAPNRLGGGSIKETSLGTVNSAQGVARAAVVNPAGQIVRGRGGATSIRTGPGRYAVGFIGDVRGCIYNATIGGVAAGQPGSGFISVSSLPTNASAVEVRTSAPADNKPENRAFHLTVTC
jgi:hypothetical protein